MKEKIWATENDIFHSLNEWRRSYFLKTFLFDIAIQYRALQHVGISRLSRQQVFDRARYPATENSIITSKPRLLLAICLYIVSACVCVYTYWIFNIRIPRTHMWCTYIIDKWIRYHEEDTN